jgi:Acetyltransferase (GNAT) domain
VAVWVAHPGSCARHARGVHRALQRWDFDVWTVGLPDGEVIGHAGVQHTTIGDRPEVELLWFIHPDQWNRGYAAEMAREAVRVAFDLVELDEVISFTVHDNAASRAVMEKLGMTYERDVEHVRLAHVLYRLLAGAEEGRGLSGWRPLSGRRADCLRRVGPGWETVIDPPRGAFRCTGPRLSAPRSSR